MPKMCADYSICGNPFLPFNSLLELFSKYIFSQRLLQNGNGSILLRPDVLKAFYVQADVYAVVLQRAP